MKLVVELTDRCNLRCSYCFEGRHGGHGLMAVETFRELLACFRDRGLSEIAFTGGEPTLHPDFEEFVRLCHEAGLGYGMVTNGWTFPQLLPLLAKYRRSLRTITFSVDAAAAAAHDLLRGAGSWERVVTAVRLCGHSGLPFTINSVVTRRNLDQAPALVQQARGWGASGIRFIPLYRLARRGDDPLDFSQAERIRAGLAVMALKAAHPDFPIALAPGFFSDDPLPCASLQGREFNVDWRGKLDLCCHLSGHVRAPAAGTPESWPESWSALQQRRAQFCEDKLARHRGGTLATADYFACDYCFRNWRAA